MTTITTANTSAADKVFVFRGFDRVVLNAGQFVESDGVVRDLANGETFKLGQTAFRDENEARQVARARVQRFCL